MQAVRLRALMALHLIVEVVKQFFFIYLKIDGIFDVVRYLSCASIIDGSKNMSEMNFF